MFPRSPYRDPFYSAPKLPPSPEEKGLRLGVIAYFLSGLLFAGLGVSVGPFPTVLAWNATYRLSLFPPSAGPRGISPTKMAHHTEWFVVMSVFPAMCWIGGMALALYLVTRPEERKLGLVGLGVGSAILAIGLLRLAIFLLQHR